MVSRISAQVSRVFCALFLIPVCLSASWAIEEEDTYSISLVKTADVDENIREVGEKRVVTKTLTVSEGDWVWKILRERGLLKRRNWGEFLSVLKRLNSSLDNLDLIRPGEKIIIPLKITPVSGITPEKTPPEKSSHLSDLENVRFENYTVKPDDKLIKVVRGRYALSQENLHSNYLELIKKLNPAIKDVDLIYPGQVIRLPVYSPEIVRKPIKPATTPVPGELTEPDEEGPEATTIARALGRVFAEMGEEWVRTGQHFIPLKSGGQINLGAKSFPIINTRSGKKVIVDLENELPENMASLVESSWKSYCIVHLEDGDDLRSALNKILPVCGYVEVLKDGEPLAFKGDIHFRITGDWIIRLANAPSENDIHIAVINMVESPATATPRVLKDFLETMGIRVVDYPGRDYDTPEELGEVEILSAGGDISSLIRALLSLVGQTYTAQVEIPVYQSEKADFELIIKADFFLRVKDTDAIINLNGLATESISLLEEHGFSVLSLAAEKEPLSIVAKVLGFVGVRHSSSPHSFLATTRNESKNIRLTLPGIVFMDAQGKAILSTQLALPDEIATLLAQRGYRILDLSFD